MVSCLAYGDEDEAGWRHAAFSLNFCIFFHSFFESQQFSPARMNHNMFIVSVFLKIVGIRNSIWDNFEKSFKWNPILNWAKLLVFKIKIKRKFRRIRETLIVIFYAVDSCFRYPSLCTPWMDKVSALRWNSCYCLVSWNPTFRHVVRRHSVRDWRTGNPININSFFDLKIIYLILYVRRFVPDNHLTSKLGTIQVFLKLIERSWLMESNSHSQSVLRGQRFDPVLFENWAPRSNMLGKDSSSSLVNRTHTDAGNWT